MYFHSKWFEPRSISSSYSVIIRVRVDLKRTVFGDDAQYIIVVITISRSSFVFNHSPVKVSVSLTIVGGVKVGAFDCCTSSTYKHNIDWDSAECLTYSINYFQRLTLKNWYSNLQQTPLNRCQQLPAP